MKLKLILLFLGASIGFGSLGVHASELGAVSSSVVVTSDDQTPRASRKRPGSMRHTEAEVENARKVTKVQAKYIRDKSHFTGAAYMTGAAGAIKVGDVALSFSGGKYKIAFESASFEMRDASTRDERRKKGISEYEYNHSWRNQKLGEDFQYGGRYEVVEQYGKINLILYDGDSDNVFAKIPLDNSNVSSFEFAEDDVLFQFQHTN